MDSTNEGREPDEGRQRRRGRGVARQPPNYERKSPHDVSSRGRSRGRARGRGRGEDRGRSQSWNRQGQGRLALDGACSTVTSPASHEFGHRGGGRQAFAGTGKDFWHGSSSSLVNDPPRHSRERGRERGGGRGRGGRGRSESGPQRNTAANLNQPSFRTISHSVERQHWQNGSEFNKTRSNEGKPNQGQNGRGRRSVSEHRGHTQQRRTPREETRPISGFRLQELLQREPNDILLSIASSRSGVLAILDQANIKEDMVVLLIHVLAKASNSTHSPQNRLSLLTSLIQSHFFVGPVTHFLVALYTGTSQKPFGDTMNAISELVQLCLKLLNILPSSSVERVAILLIHFKEILNKHGLSMFNLKEEIDKLEKQKDDIVKQIQGRELMRDQESREESNIEEPPDDFRQITIIPTSQDFKNKGRPFIRKNIVFGSYQSVDHYLDVQFRLLREDFLSPLRDGIKEMLANEKHGNLHRRIQDIKVYDHVHIQEPICTKTGIVHAVSFDVSKLHQIRWESSKRLIHGTLLCFSTDNFKTFLFGTVAERDVKQLQKGIIFVQMEDLNMQHTDISPFDEFRMIESSAYFEAYRHNLEGLQEIQEDTLPFKKYILNNDAEYVDSPRYIRGRGSIYDFQCLLPTTSKHLEVKVMNRQAWPSADKLQLDHSQFKALQHAITKEFCVIQGPPGTGKTFIGLKIVQLLFANKKVWNQDHRPILIVCYTNHALDQFLEGILTFHGCYGLCRIGGGGNSENENLQACRLSNLRRDKEFRDSVPQNIRSACSAAREEMETIGGQIKEMAVAIREARSSIIHEIFLQHLMSPDQRETLMNCREVDPSQCIMIQWLWPKGKPTILDKTSGQQNSKGGEILEADKDEMETLEKGVDEDFNQFGGRQRILEEDDYERVSEIYEKMQNLPSNYSHNNQFAVTLEQLEENVCSQKDNDEDTQMFTEKTLSKKGQNKGKDQEDTEWNEVKKRSKKDKQRLKKNLLCLNVMPEGEVKTVTNVWNIPEDQRWRLYRYWVLQYCTELVMRMRYLKNEFSQKARQLNELRMEEDYLLIKDCTVIGMTTTGAAKYRQVIQRVQPRIVIVEEAAEVFESHIVTTLSVACEHLILIGDHQQLRPNPTMYKLAKDYHLDVSLFERMVKNGMHCDRLGIQHRMRPEISSLIVPHVYSELQDHESVFNYENIKGVNGNIFFIDHKFLEEHVEDTKSRSNLHEAEYLAALCKYFLQQEYSPCQITVLTTYTGQMFLLRKVMPRNEYEGVRITPVDNYQGEENDIILLSLVRSNEDGRIGFLSVSNRVCVALSRAKKGFFAIGNMELLAKSSNLWNGIIRQLKQDGKVVQALPLACQNHPESILEVKEASDFKKAPEGGCSLPCEYRLACGHACILKCHPYDPSHIEYICRKPCRKKLCERQHCCPLKCFEKCGKCCEPVEKYMPTCGHIQTMECHQDPVSFSCCFACEKELPCGHSCQNMCGEPCGVQCKVILDEREWPCGHKLSTYCHRNPSNYKCHIEVTHQLPCGHQLTTQCHISPDEYKCHEKVSCQLVCGHTAELECMVSSNQLNHVCMEKILIDLPCRHSKEVSCYQKMEKAVCNEIVKVQCSHKPEHVYFAKCEEKKDAQCPMMCCDILPCGHDCKGKCAECQGIHHPPCLNLCRRVHPCGHQCGSQCGKPCPPCRYPCGTFCGHSLCTKQCGMQCYSCKKQCSWNCRHYRCSQPCVELCNRPQCNAHCPRILACGHFCIGLCGEICPPICGVCNPWYIHQITSFLRIPLTVHSKFLQLRPCAHVVEVTFMDAWMKKQDGIFPRDLRYYCCPLCKQMISFCPRYGNQIKRRYREMTAAKQAISDQSFAADYNVRFRWDHLIHLTPFQQRFQPYFYKSYHDWGHLALACVKLFQGAVDEAKTASLEDSTYPIWMTNIDKLLSNINPEDEDIRSKLLTTLDELKILYMKVQVLKIMRRITVPDRKPLPPPVFSRLIQTAERAMSVLKRSDYMVDSVNTRIKEASDIIVDKFRAHERGYIDDFQKHLNNMIPDKRDLTLDRRWMVCEHGHVYAVDRQGGNIKTCSKCVETAAVLMAFDGDFDEDFDLIDFDEDF